MMREDAESKKPSRVDDNIHEGHRGRMRDKLAAHGDRVFHTYELLEMLLYSIVPYKNTNPIAKNLIKTFKNIDGVLSASREELMTVDGVGPRIAELIASVSEFSKSVFNGESYEGCPVGGNSSAGSRDFVGYMELGEELAGKFGKSSEPTVVFILYNSRFERLCCKELFNAEFSSAAVKADVFVNLAIENAAVAAIVAYSRPYGPAFPMSGDMETVKLLRESLQQIGVTLLEHYVISGSMFTGMVNNVSNVFFKNKQACVGREETPNEE